MANRVEVRARHPSGVAAARVVKRAAYRYLRTLGLRGCELSIALVGDSEIRAMNHAWREVDRATDVLSFALGDATPRGAARRHLGDLAISIDTARRAARAQGLPLRDELSLYVAHGLLHLLGHDHHTAAQGRRMGALEHRLLARAGLTRRGSFFK